MASDKSKAEMRKKMEKIPPRHARMEAQALRADRQNQVTAFGFVPGDQVILGEADRRAIAHDKMAMARIMKGRK